MARPPVFPAEDKVRIVLSILAARLLAAIAGVCSWRSRAARGFCRRAGPPAAGRPGRNDGAAAGRAQRQQLTHG